MSGDNGMAAKTTEEKGDHHTDREMKQSTALLIAGEGDVKQTKLPSKPLAVKNAKTFIKPNFKAPQTEIDQPVPWPMPPKSHGKQSEEEGAKVVPPNRDADKEYLTPQSSFAQYNVDSSSQVDTLVHSESHCEASETYSRESSVRRESFSSVGTGISLALVDSSDSGSSESVSKVDIDADEFARFLSAKTKSSQSVLDFTQLFAEEGQEGRHVEHGTTSPGKSQGTSEFSENSTTPKAVKAFIYRKTTKTKSNTVSLEEALEFSPDYKTLGPQSRPPLYDEASSTGEHKSKGLRKCESEAIENELGAESGLRRPMASKRKPFVLLSQAKENVSSQEDVSEEGLRKETSMKSEDKKVTTEGKRQSCNVEETTPPVKGVIMRAQSHVSHVAGIRRAETGRIMSRAELQMKQPIVFQESPNPKSLNPAGFPNEEDVTTIDPSSVFPDSSSRSDKAVTEQLLKNNTSPTSEQPSTNKKPSSSSGALRVDDGSFLSPGILSRKKKYGTEEYRIDSFQFSEHEGSSGLLNRFSSGFRKVQLAVAKKSSHEVTQAAESAIIVSGTIDEAVCKICVVCRKQLEYDVYVKDTGKKIKVESRRDGRNRHLRATILVRQQPGEASNCEVHIRQSRSDGMKTSLATLWNFYQRLEAGLNEMG